MIITRFNNTPVPHRNYYRPMADDFFRSFEEMVNSPMRTGVRETEDAYLFDAELPGFEPDEIELSIHDGILTISAQHKENDENDQGFASRSIRRSFTVNNVDEENISAEYKHGVLRMKLPKFKEPEQPAPRRIEIR